MLLTSGFSVTFDGPGCSRTPAAAAGASMAVVTTKEEREKTWLGKRKGGRRTDLENHKFI